MGRGPAALPVGPHRARRTSPYRTLEDTFGGRAGWTVEHSHSGFNAFRHHLLQYRTATRPALYREMVPNLVTARAILDAVREGRIDVGPLDAYWHLLIATHQPDADRAAFACSTSTATATLPAFVTAPRRRSQRSRRCGNAFADVARQAWFRRMRG